MNDEQQATLARDSTEPIGPFPYIGVQGVNDSCFVVESIMNDYFDCHKLLNYPSHGTLDGKNAEKHQQVEPSQGFRSVTQSAVMKIFGRAKSDDKRAEDIHADSEDIVEPSSQNDILPINFSQDLREELKQLSELELSFRLRA